MNLLIMSPSTVSQLLDAVFALFLLVHILRCVFILVVAYASATLALAMSTWVLFLRMFLENFFEVELLQEELGERGLADARFSADHDGESGGRTRICQLLQITPCEGP